nr:hypothetical protein [Trinickia caryophylli]
MKTCSVPLSRSSRGPHERAERQIERRQCFFFAKALQMAQRIGKRRQIVVAPEHALPGREQARDRLAVREGEDRAQRLVAFPQRVECTVPGLDIERALDSQNERHMVGRARLLELRQEPEPLLGKRQRKRRIAWRRDDGWQGSGAAGTLVAPLGNGLCEGRERRTLEQHAERYVPAKDRTHAVQHANRKQRVATKFEEMVPAADARDLQQFAPKRRKRCFDLAIGLLVVCVCERVVVGGGQGLAVELAVGCERQGVEHHEGGGNHVLGQARLQVRAQQLRKVGSPD